ncbi:YpsA SLOG family protein [Thermodesulfobacteriota bacterium B35]
MKIISGGQTGADQAGLDVTIKLGIPHGGAIPKGRMTEAGVLPDRYNLDELTTKSYPKRTEKRVTIREYTAKPSQSLR